MYDLSGRESSDAENGNHQHHPHKYTGSSDSTDGVGGVGSSRRHSDMDEEKLQNKRKELADLAVWMSGLNATKLPLDDPHDLCDGRAFAELLHTIDQSFFDDTWLEKMPAFTSKSNVVVKRSNLRKLWRKIADYIQMELNRQLPQTSRWTDIDERVDGIEESDLPVAVDLAMLVVTLAHIGHTKKQFVEYSQDLSGVEAAAMHTVARLIGDVIREIPEMVSYHEVSSIHGHDDDGHELNVSLQESSFANSTSGGGGTSSGTNGTSSSSRRRTLSNGQSLLEAQLDAVRQEKDALVKEVDRLTKALDQAQLNSSMISSESNDISILEKQNDELKLKKRQAEEKVHELESQLDQLRSTVEELTIESDELKSGQKDVHGLRMELHSAQDEVEVWRTRADQLAKEADVGKKREKECRDLQGQVKLLTSRLEHHVKQSTIDEDAKEGAKQLRMQLGTLTAMKETLEIQVNSKERVIHDLENKLIQYKEKVKGLEDRKDDLIAERNALQEELSFKDGVTPRSLHESMFEGGNLSFEPFSEKSKLPLEVENKRLVERIQELEELEPLRGEIAVMNSRNGVLEEANLVLTKQKEELAKKLVELDEKMTISQQNVSGDVVELRIQLEKANVEVERLKEAEQRAERRVADVEHEMKIRREECDMLNSSLNGAKAIIDHLEDQCRPVGEDNGTSVHQFKELQSENERLRAENERLKIRLETETTLLEEENRLITTAAHHMAFNRPMDELSMSMRAQGGSDAVSSTRPPTLLETQKMSGALPWRSASASPLPPRADDDDDDDDGHHHRRRRPSGRGLPIALTTGLIAVMFLLIIVAWFLSKMYSEINAPPIA